MARSRLRDAQFFDEDVLGEDEHSILTHYFKDLGDVDPLSGNAGKYLRVDALASGIEYVETTGSGSWDKHLDDNEKIFFGTDYDVEMYFDGSRTVISGSDLNLGGLIVKDGNVGIRTIPSHDFQVVDSDGEHCIVTIGRSTSERITLKYQHPNSYIYGYNSGIGMRDLYLNSTLSGTNSGVLIKAAGDVGIGTEVPEARLHLEMDLPGASTTEDLLYIKGYEPRMRIEDTRTDDIWDIRSQYGGGHNNFRVENNNDTFFEITENGVVSHAGQSGCHFYRGSSDQSIPNNTWTTIEFNTEIYDIQNEFDNSSNYRFTCTEDGIYLVIVRATILSLSSGDDVSIGIYKNGSQKVTKTNSVTSGYPHGEQLVSITLECDATDYIEGKISQNSGTSRNLHDNPTHSYICIAKIA